MRFNIVSMGAIHIAINCFFGILDSLKKKTKKLENQETAQQSTWKCKDSQTATERARDFCLWVTVV